MIKHTYRHWVDSKGYHIFRSFKVYWAYRELVRDKIKESQKPKPIVKTKKIILTDKDRELGKLLAKAFGNCSVSYPDHTYGKWINDEFIVKPSVQTKDLRTVWFEDINPNDIDTKWYNLDGTYKYEF